MQGRIIQELQNRKEREVSMRNYSPIISKDMPLETGLSLQKLDPNESGSQEDCRFIIGAPQAGKILVAERIKSRLPQLAVILRENDYYKQPQGQIKFSQDYNFDDPESIDWQLFSDAVNQLKQGKEIYVQSYDVSTKSRSEELKQVKPAKIIIIVGKFIFSTKAISDQINLKVYVDAQNDVRLARRIQEHLDYGETLESIIDYYMKFCKESVEKYQGKEKLLADVIIPNYGEFCNYVAVDMMIDYIELQIKRKDINQPSQASMGISPFVTKRKGSLDIEHTFQQSIVI